MFYKETYRKKHMYTEKKHEVFGCHIDAAEQQRALNFELVVSD